MKRYIRIFFLLLSVLSGCFAFYDYISLGFIEITSIFLFVIFLFSSAITILIPANIKLRFLHKPLNSFKMWIIVMIFTFVIVYVIDKVQNLSPILFSTSFYWEEGVDVDFRKNGTFRAFNQHLLGGGISYGKYELRDSFIILQDKLKFGDSNMKDILVARKDGVYFRMEKPWRINEGVMSYKYEKENIFRMTNNTAYNIDSISLKLSYSNEESTFLILEPGQQIDYVFKTKNSVDGRYLLTYKIKDQSNELNELENILNGYPLGTVKSISFEDQNVIIAFIFGNSIKKVLK